MGDGWLELMKKMACSLFAYYWVYSIYTFKTQVLLGDKAGKWQG